MKPEVLKQLETVQTFDDLKKRLSAVAPRFYDSRGDMNIIDYNGAIVNISVESDRYAYPFNTPGDVKDDYVTPYVLKPAEKRESVLDESLQEWVFPLLYANNGVMWKADMTLYLENRDSVDAWRFRPIVSVGEFKETHDLMNPLKYTCLQPKEELEGILRSFRSEWTVKFYDEHKDNLRPEMLLLAPELEQLYKAQYRFANNIVDHGCDFQCIGPNVSMTISGYDSFNKACKPGANMQEIFSFKADKKTLASLRDIPTIEEFAVYGQMASFGTLTKDTVDMIKDMHMDRDDLENFYSILTTDFVERDRDGAREEHPVHLTTEKVVNYIRRQETGKAMPVKETLTLLSDYARMCADLDAQPSLSGSLRDNHAICVMNYNMVQEQRRVLAEQSTSYKELMDRRAPYDRWKVNNWSDGEYFVVNAKDGNDLVFIGADQHHCVGTYRGKEERGECGIYTIRSVKAPDKILITLELNPEMNHIRQQFYAHDRRVDNADHLAFIDAWMARVRERVKTGAERIPGEAIPTIEVEKRLADEERQVKDKLLTSQNNTKQAVEAAKEHFISMTED